MKKLLFISLCLFNMPTDLISSDSQTIQDTKDGIASFVLLASLGMTFVGGKIGYDIGSYYGSYVGKTYDDVALPEKLEILKKLDEKAEEKSEEVLARAMVNLFMIAVCPFSIFLLPFIGNQGKKPDLHEFEKKYSQEYGDVGGLIGGATGFVGTLLLGAYLAGKV